MEREWPHRKTPRWRAVLADGAWWVVGAWISSPSRSRRHRPAGYSKEFFFFFAISCSKELDVRAGPKAAVACSRRRRPTARRSWCAAQADAAAESAASLAPSPACSVVERRSKSETARGTAESEQARWTGESTG